MPFFPVCFLLLCRYAERIKKRDGVNLFMRQSVTLGGRPNTAAGDGGHSRVSAATYRKMLSGGRASLDGDVTRPKGGLGLRTMSMPDDAHTPGPQQLSPLRRSQ
jgi:hypothetical protein